MYEKIKAISGKPICSIKEGILFSGVIFILRFINIPASYYGYDIIIHWLFAFVISGYVEKMAFFYCFIFDIIRQSCSSIFGFYPEKESMGNTI